MPARPQKTKVAVLGGGPAALAAAFELTDPRLGGRYEVTVYQPGWRLGGKCASGRNRGVFDRIEEHGLHVWFGFYDNAFNLIQRCYDDPRRKRTPPLETWQAAFKKCSDIVLFEHWQGQWKPWHVRVPENDEIPGSGKEITPWDFLERLVDWLLAEWGVAHARHAETLTAAALDRRRRPRAWSLRGLVGRVGEDIGELAWAGARHLLGIPARLLRATAQEREGDPLERELERVCELLGRTKRWFSHLLLDEIFEHEHLRRYYMLVDFWEAVVSGMLADDLLNEGFGKANSEDLRAWLKRHGADDRTLEHAPFLKGLYDLVFAYRDGDKDQADLAAGKALQAMIRIVAGYKGAILWEMQAGMGDTVFTPLYDVLRSRGVTFEFFHWVTRLGLSADKRSVETIEVVPQAKLVKRTYNPIVTVKRVRSWPNEPDWSQLEGGAALEQQRVDFERNPNPLGRAPVTLRAGEDFDEVVLGIPVGALAPICAELAEAGPRFEQMLDNHHTVITQGVQLWLDRTAQELGWPYVEHTITSAYVNHLDTYSNMSHLIPRERWPRRAQPAEIAYLCGVVADAQAPTQADADRQVAANALRLLQQDTGPLWPDAQDRGSGGFDWQHLVDPSGAAGTQRLDAQFFRANFQPHERYVTTPAGSVKHRLRADESGFDNLKLAGDWTRNGLDGGSVEAAVTSGMQAARAISGWPAHIPGESGWLVDD